MDSAGSGVDRYSLDELSSSQGAQKAALAAGFASTIEGRQC
jgi:hypothetical protein